MRTLILVLTACLACGGPQQEQPPPPDAGGAPVIAYFTLSHDSMPYGGGDVLLQWRATGATAVTIDQGVGAQPVSGQVYATVKATTTFTLTATGPGGTTTASASVAVATSLKITGHVAWPDNGDPVPNAAVQVIGKGVVAADSSGNYSFDGATLPYDVAAIAPGGTAAVVFQGVTATNPWVSLFGASHHTSLGSSGAHLTGRVDGGTPLDGSHQTLVGFVNASSSNVTTESSDGTWAMYEGWNGTNPEYGDVLALEYTCSQMASPADGGGMIPDCSRPASYDGFAASSGHGISDGNYYIEELELAPTGTSSVSGTVSWAAGYALSFVSSLLVSHGGELKIESSHGTSFAFQMPSPPAASHVATAIGARALSPAGEISDGIAIGPGANIALTLPAAPVLITPSAGGTLSPSTQLRWSAGASFYLVSVAGPNNYHLSLFTTQTSTSLPDLSPLGIALPAAGTFSWNVVGYTPTAKVEMPPLDSQLPTLASGTAAVSLTSTFKTP